MQILRLFASFFSKTGKSRTYLADGDGEEFITSHTGSHLTVVIPRPTFHFMMGDLVVGNAVGNVRKGANIISK